MAIPDFQLIMLPLLSHYNDGMEHSNRETIDSLAKYFKLTDEERAMLLPSGRQEIFTNRVGWAKTHLNHAELLGSARRGVCQITTSGLDVLSKNPVAINMKFLEQFNAYKVWRNSSLKQVIENDELDTTDSIATPDELLEATYTRIRADLATEILQRVKNCSPAFFERLVVEVIVNMGYGGSKIDAGKAIGKTGDGGIDGIIKEDKLGLDAIFIQAKRWDHSVGRPEIQKFVGALTGQRAKKGLFITTADFTADANDYITRIDTKVVLINGELLSQLMIDYNVGVSTIATYELKSIDMDYFINE